jgi:hypothetical protein
MIRGAYRTVTSPATLLPPYHSDRWGWGDGYVRSAPLTSSVSPSVKPMDENERCGKVADHSVVRCRGSAVANANPDKPGFIGRPSSHGGPHLWWQPALDHGVVHDIGESAFEPVASVKPMDKNERCGKVADHSVVRCRGSAVANAITHKTGFSGRPFPWWTASLVAASVGPRSGPRHWRLRFRTRRQRQAGG